jgi:protein TonB
VTSVEPPCPTSTPRDRDTIVRLIGRIAVDGSINDVTATVSEPAAVPPAEFTRAALDAVRQWTFTPTLLNGEPVEVNITIHVIYRAMP